MSGFSDPIISGGGDLVYPAVQSPNFQLSPFKGWKLTKDGTLYAADVVLPDGQGVSVFFASTAPATTHTGDLWYDTGNGLALSRWDGTAWTAYSIGTGALADSAVTPAKISALTATLIGAIGPLNVNPYFTGDDTSGWFPSDATLAGTATPAAGSPYPSAGVITPTVSGAGHIFQATAAPVTVGDPYAISGWLYSATLSSLLVDYVWKDSGGTATYETHTVAVTPGTWTPFALSSTAPSTAATCQVLVQNSTDLTAFQVTGLVLQSNLVSGGRFVAYGASGEFLAYSGTPASGNLVMSASAAAGSDPYGNAYPEGLKVSDPSSGAYVLLDPSTGKLTVQSSLTGYQAVCDGGSFTMATPSSAANPATYAAQDSPLASIIESPSDGTNGAAEVKLYAGTASVQPYLTSPPIVALTPDQTAAETWHDITVDSGWTVVQQPQYRLMNDGLNVELRGQVTHASMTASTNVNSATALPSGYQPAANRFYRAAMPTDGAGPVYMGTDGVLTVRANATYPATQAILDGIYSL